VSPESFPRAFQAFLSRRPFLPFLIELESGDRISVTHPEAIRQFGDLFVHRAPDRTQKMFEVSAVCQFIDPPHS
jgi:hypothetical protein